jgi:hypothetical protein
MKGQCTGISANFETHYCLGDETMWSGGNLPKFRRISVNFYQTIRSPTVHFFVTAVTTSSNLKITNFIEL